MNYRTPCLYTLLLFFSHSVFAQYYNTGQDPASLKWMQIKTERFNVIFPREYADGGMDFAKTLEDSYSKLHPFYPAKKFKIPVVIHNHSVHSNGYVAWAPRRMEIYPTPEQNTIPLDHVQQLAIHEITHVFQMTSLRKGFSKALSILLGEQSTGLMASLLPLWFLEGQAVLAETALTESGRGRSSYFMKPLKTISVERGKMYKYDKILNGSFRDYVPDHYQSGYQMVTYAMVKHDPLIWKKVIDYTARYPFTISPVNISLYRNTGLTKKRLFNEAFDTLNTIWTEEIGDNKTEDYVVLNPDKKRQFINYYSPVFSGPDSIFAIKTSLSDPPEFVLLNPAERTEKKIHVPGQMYPYFITYGNGKIVWVETSPDIRWENRRYSNVRMFDINSGKLTQLTRRSRYLAASVSPDGRNVAAIENTTENLNNLVFIDTERGKTIHSVASPGNMHLQRPQWSQDGDKISVIYLTEEGEGIASYDIADRKWEILLNAAREDLQASFIRKDSLFYVSSLSGTDNAYLKTADRTLVLTRSKFGINDLSLEGKSLLFSDYSLQGNNISTVQLAGEELSQTDNLDSSSYLINHLDLDTILPEKPAETDYKLQPYRKWQHLFNFHSWMPFYADIEEIQADPSAIRPGATIMSQNHLSTLTTSVGYEYSAGKNHVFHSKITWAGWLPVFESRLDYGNDPFIYKSRDDDDPSVIQSGVRFYNTISLPLNFSAGKFTSYLRPSFSSDYKNDLVYMRGGNYYDSDQMILSARLFFSNIYRYAHRDIYPKWGQALDVNYSFAPFDKEIYGTVLTIKTAFYFPGFLPDNGIRIRYERENQVPSRFYFGNRVPFPRGYKDIISMELDLVTVDYVLPLLYPDFNLANLFYLKRIRTGIFHDYATGRDNIYYIHTETGVRPQRNDFREDFRSYGFELLADFHVLRIPFMISGGVQTAWKTLSDSPSIMLLFKLDIYGMAIGRKWL
jgi:hypothetical protein